MLVDAVSALAGAELRFDDWDLALVYAGTQKCLALPPGLCVYARSERAMARTNGPRSGNHLCRKLRSVFLREGQHFAGSARS